MPEAPQTPRDSSHRGIRQIMSPILRPLCLLLAISGLSTCLFVSTASSDIWSDEETSKTNAHEGNGVLFRAGHIEGQGIPQTLPITPLELFPYHLSDEQLFFSDLRFFPTNSGTIGGNAGAGYRYYYSDWDRIFGISGWYDADNTRSLYFQQLGLSLESYGEFVDFRTNLYLPVGETTRNSFSGIVAGSTRFRGDNIVYDQTRSWYTAMKGIDMEAGIPIPGEFSKDHALRVYGGWYHFSGDNVSSITGGQARVQANIISGLDAHVQVMYDPFFQTRGFVGLSWTFGPLHRSKVAQTSTYGRMGEHITRNYTVVGPERTQIDLMTAINPATGRPYTVSHVWSAADAGGSGNFGSPFQTLSQAQSAGRDIIFAQSGSVFTGIGNQIKLNPGERVFGDANNIQHFIPVSGGNLLMPHGPSPGDRPIIANSLGHVIQLASNTEVAGFRIQNAAGNGIMAEHVNSAILRDISIENAGPYGILLSNSTGQFRFSNVSVSHTVGNAFSVYGGDASVVWDGRITSGGGRDVFISSTTGGMIDLSGVSFDGTGGQGIKIFNSNGNATFNNVTLVNTSTEGITVQGGEGKFTFNGTTKVDGAAGSSIYVDGLGTNGAVTFHDVTIDRRQDKGIAIENTDGHVAVTGRAAISNQLGSTKSGIRISNSTGFFDFNRVDIAEATGDPGVSLVNNTGDAATLFGTLNIATNNATGLFADHGGLLGINPTNADNSVDLSKGGYINAVNGAAVDIQGTDLRVNLTSVSASNAAYGVRLDSNSGQFAVYGTGSEGSGGRIQNTTTGVLLHNNEQVAFQWLTLDNNGTGVSSNNNTYVVLLESVIKNSSGYGIEALDTTNLQVVGGSLTNNGAANIYAQFGTQRSYSYLISSTELKSNTSDNIVLSTFGGGVGSSLSLNVNDSYFENNLAGTSAIRADWNGGMGAVVNNSVFFANGGSNNGVLINNATTSALTSLGITNSDFTSAGGNDTFLRTTLAGPAQINLNSNQVQFNATGGTAFRMALASSSNVTIAKNNILDSTDGATGILFDTITGPGSVRIEDNLMDFGSSGGLLDRGIIFTSVTNTIQLSGDFDNRILGADTPFFVPFGTTTGSIFVNGVRQP